MDWRGRGLLLVGVSSRAREVGGQKWEGARAHGRSAPVTRAENPRAPGGEPVSVTKRVQVLVNR